MLSTRQILFCKAFQNQLLRLERVRRKEIRGMMDGQKAGRTLMRSIFLFQTTKKVSRTTRRKEYEGEDCCTVSLLRRGRKAAGLSSKMAELPKDDPLVCSANLFGERRFCERR